MSDNLHLRSQNNAVLGRNVHITPDWMGDNVDDHNTPHIWFSSFPDPDPWDYNY